MKPIDGFKAEAPRAGYPMLPKGLYIAKIKKARVDGAEPDQQLVLRVDICEGEYTGYYTSRYNSEKAAGGQYEVKYKGDFRIQIPNSANPRREHPEWDLSKFNNAIWAIEDSNDGFHWGWEEKSLEGLTVGINVRQGTFNGSPYTSIGRLESVKRIRDGRCKVMQDMAPRSSGEATVTAAPTFTPVEDDDIPF